MSGEYKNGKADRIDNVVFYTGSSHPELTAMVTKQLDTVVSDSIHDSFSNGERRIELHANVRRRHVYIFQTGCSTDSESTNDYIMELLLMVNAARLSDAESITVVCPNFPYARQDKKDRSRTPISSRILAEMLQTAGVTRMVTMDLHSSQIQGFFTIPVDNLFARDLIIRHLEQEFFTDLTPTQVKEQFVLVSPDAGGAKRVLKMAQKMELNSVLMHKQRDHSKKNHVDKTIIVGEDSLEGKTCIIVDDMADTLGTVVKACEALVEHGAGGVIVCITHGVLSGAAIDRLNACDAITHLVTSNTIPQDQNVARSNKVRVFDVSELLATCIERIVNGGSISELFTGSAEPKAERRPNDEDDWPMITYMDGHDLRPALHSHYQVVTELGLWDWFKNELPKIVGTAEYLRHPNIKVLNYHPKIVAHGHSGGSWAVTMRYMQRIAEVGFEQYCEETNADLQQAPSGKRSFPEQ